MRELIKGTIAKKLFATLFYIKLTARPKKNGSKFQYHAQIRCLRPPDDKAYPKIFERLQNCVIFISGVKIVDAELWVGFSFAHGP